MKTNKAKKVESVITDEKRKEVLDKVSKDMKQYEEEKKKKIEAYERERLKYALAKDYVDIATQKEEATNYLKTLQSMKEKGQDVLIGEDRVVRSEKYYGLMYQQYFWLSKQLQMRFQQSLLQANVTIEELEKFMETYTK